MINYLEILRLNHLGYSQRTIETTAHCSRHTVREVLAEMDKHGIQWPLDDDITNADLEQMLFPDKYKSVCLYIEPDYPYIHRELAKRGVTLTLLWEEYDLSAEGSDADACYLESVISRERNPELKRALQDLDDYLFGW